MSELFVVQPDLAARITDLEDALRDAIKTMSSRGLIAASNRIKSVLESPVAMRAFPTSCMLTTVPKPEFGYPQTLLPMPDIEDLWPHGPPTIT